MTGNPITRLKRGAPRWVTARSEAVFRSTFDATSSNRAAETTTVPVTVLMFMGHGQVPQAVASLRTFLEFAGRPERIIVTSDGTLDDDDRAVLHRIESSIEFPSRLVDARR